MPRTSGIQLLEWVRHHSPQTVRLLMTGYAEYEDAVEAINRGQVYYYLIKPWRSGGIAPYFAQCRGQMSPGTEAGSSPGTTPAAQPGTGDSGSSIRTGELAKTNRVLEKRIRNWRSQARAGTADSGTGKISSDRSAHEAAQSAGHRRRGGLGNSPPNALSQSPGHGHYRRDKFKDINTAICFRAAISSWSH